jgi:hypothetical protein
MYTCEGERNEISVYARMFPFELWQVPLKWLVIRDLEVRPFHKHSQKGAVSCCRCCCLLAYSAPLNSNVRMFL